LGLKAFWQGSDFAVSGGGFHATLFHIGSCWRLLELCVLQQLTRISSVSGGSIFAGGMASRWTALVQNPTVTNYKQLVIDPLRQFCRLQIDTVAIGEGLFTLWKSVADVVEEKYSQLFQRTLDQLVDSPTFVFNVTNLQTGRSFRFSKPYMGDYRIGLIRNPTVALATAVAASTAFPRFLSPAFTPDTSRPLKMPISIAVRNTPSASI
jgi:NTE family protein